MPTPIDFPQRYQVYTSRTNVVLTTDDCAEALLALLSLSSPRRLEAPWLWDSLDCRRWYLETRGDTPTNEGEPCDRSC